MKMTWKSKVKNLPQKVEFDLCKYEIFTVFQRLVNFQSEARELKYTPNLQLYIFNTNNEHITLRFEVLGMGLGVRAGHSQCKSLGSISRNTTDNNKKLKILLNYQ